MSLNLLERVRVVLVGTTHPGNIGAAARAMKTMGVGGLYLVEPKRFPCAEATARAAGADDILARCRICATFEEAIADCALVIAASARRRSIPWPEADPREAARQALEEAGRGDVALVFGREHSGLTNDELDLCNLMVRIPTAEAFASLNLAAAVQVLVYELRQAALAGTEEGQPAADPAAPAEEMERLYAHLEEVMIAVGFLDPAHPRRLMRRLRRLFSRALPDQQEVNILRGLLAAVQETVKARAGEDADQP